MKLGCALQNFEFLLCLFQIQGRSPGTTARAMFHEVAHFKAVAFGALEILSLPFGNKTMDLTDEKFFLGKAIILCLTERTAPGFGGFVGFRASQATHPRRGTDPGHE